LFEESSLGYLSPLKVFLAFNQKVDLFVFQNQYDGMFFSLKVSLLGFLSVGFRKFGTFCIYQSHGVLLCRSAIV